MDKDELIRYLEKKLRLQAVQGLDEERVSVAELERDFAIAALDLMRRQPAMERLLELEPWESDLVH